MALNELYTQYATQLEDFWNRRGSVPVFKHGFSVLGCPVEITSNQKEILKAVELAIPLYSIAPTHPDRTGYRLQVIFHAPPVDPGPLPNDLFPYIHYTANGDWFNMNLGGWGNCFTDLRSGFGVAVLTPDLAERPDLISRHLLNTLFTNYFTRNGFAMLHATALVRGDRVLLLMAPHNSGKSTTALRLTLSGQFHLLSDSQIYITTTERGLQLTGFPVGRGKLRRDMLPHFPQLVPLLTPEQVRDETKFVLDLHKLDSSLVYDEAIYPAHIDLCLLKRSGQRKTTIQEATLAETWEAILLNSLHYDNPDVWEENLRLIEPLVNIARLYHLEIGTDGEGIVEKILEFGN